MQTNDLKSLVKVHWENETCGTRYSKSKELSDYYKEIEIERYKREPFIFEFAEFEKYSQKKVLEIGVGAGSDFVHWIKNKAKTTGIDLTRAAIDKTLEHTSIYNFSKEHFKLSIGDAENLNFPNEQFDLVYSWGVLHHSPDTKKALEEIFRVLKKKGRVKVMIYHRPSWTGWILALLYSFKKKSLYSPKKAIYHFLESPGTKSYSKKEARQLFMAVGFKNIHLKTKLSCGDLLDIHPSRKYNPKLFNFIRLLYPAFLVRLLGDRFGLYLLIEAEK